MSNINSSSNVGRSDPTLSKERGENGNYIKEQNINISNGNSDLNTNNLALPSENKNDESATNDNEMKNNQDFLRNNFPYNNSRNSSEGMEIGRTPFMSVTQYSDHQPFPNSMTTGTLPGIGPNDENNYWNLQNFQNDSSQNIGEYRELSFPMFRDLHSQMQLNENSGNSNFDYLGMNGMGDMNQYNRIKGNIREDPLSIHRNDLNHIPLQTGFSSEQRLRTNLPHVNSYNIWSMNSSDDKADSIRSEFDNSILGSFHQGNFISNNQFSVPSQFNVGTQQMLQNTPYITNMQSMNSGITQTQNQTDTLRLSNSQNVPQMNQLQRPLRYNVDAPEFRPTSVTDKGNYAIQNNLTNSYNSPTKSKRYNPPTDSQSQKIGRITGQQLPRRHSVSIPSSTCMHVAPMSGLSETNSTKLPITINPMKVMSSVKNGTSSRQNQDAQSKDLLLKTIYHKLITCQSGDCKRRHSCIECLECNSLFCENCSNINLYGLLLMVQEKEMEMSNDEQDGWELIGSTIDVHQIPGFCPVCDKQERFCVNLAMMKLLMHSEEYRRFSGMVHKARSLQRNRS